MLNFRRELGTLVAVLFFVEAFGKDVGLVIKIPDGVDSTRGPDYWGAPSPHSPFFSNSSSHASSSDDVRASHSVATISSASLPSNLSIIPVSGSAVQVWWDAPIVVGALDYRLKLIPLSEKQTGVRSFLVSKAQRPFALQDLTPGASYELQLYARVGGRDSAAFISSNFTTRPNAPGRFIVWYRNETTMLVLWQPPFPNGVYSAYRVSITPPDAQDSVLFVEKDGDPPGPAQAAFHGLVPGRAYNITVETKSGEQISTPTTAQYRTIPMPPRNLTFDTRSLTPYSFVVRWEEPAGRGEYDSYRVSLLARNQMPLIVPAFEPRQVEFSRKMQPGVTYNVVVKTMSDNVVSWPTSGNVTTRPLPVHDLEITGDPLKEEVRVTWTPDDRSYQDKYIILYQELETLNGHSRSFTSNTSHLLHSGADLYPGRNYSVSVVAVSNSVHSQPVSTFFLTKPASPIIEELQSVHDGLNISWKSDVNSRQDKYIVFFIREDTGDEASRDAVNPHILIEDLYPGAGYEIRIFAISHGEYSEPHVYFKAVYPNPIRDLKIAGLKSASVILSWLPPEGSLYDYFVVRFWPIESEQDVSERIANETDGVVIDKLEPGQRYVFEVSASSGRVESLEALTVVQTVPPSKVYSVVPFLDSRNITFEWSRPEGRIDFYTIVWWSVDTPDRKASKDIPGDQETEGINRKLSVSIGDLFPGDLYQFEVYTTSHGVRSETVTISTRTTPLITSEITFVPSRRHHDSFTVRYTPTPNAVSTFDLYRFEVSDPSIDIKEKSANDTDRKVVFGGLVPGRLYKTTVWTVSGDVKSPPLMREVQLVPRPIRHLSALEITDSAVYLEWDPPEGDHDSYEVHYRNGEKVITLTAPSEAVNITGLRAHTSYPVTVYTKAGGLTNFDLSEPVSATFTTREGTPGMVSELSHGAVSPTAIALRWSSPDPNGVLTGHRVVFWNELDFQRHEVMFGPDSRNATIGDLVPGQNYVFEVQAQTKVGWGQKAVLQMRTPIEAPPRPEPGTFPMVVDKTTSTATLRFNKSFFSSKNGPITNFSLVIAEDASKEGAFPSPLSWTDVQSYANWPPYQVFLPLEPQQETVENVFQIGTDEACAQSRVAFCNGPLKPGTNYRVKMRAFTSDTQYTDTLYSDLIITDFETSNVGLAVTLPILVVVLTLIVVVFVKRRKEAPLKPVDPGGRRPELDAIPDSLIKTSRPVLLRNFPDHFRYMSADSDFRFSEEYEAVRSADRDLACVAAELPVNRPKNRFTNILPYDHSRVKLQPTDDEEGSDYINANYVPGYNSPRAFVVTQGPLASTRDDFWRMCWETNSRSIIMLTRCIEKGREKCDHYWPYDTAPVYYGNIQVTILNESHYHDWTISEFRVCKGDACRIIRHFHFTTWPDFGVPDPPQTLVRFVRAFREKMGSDQKPIVIHCSAGVGRSGTFIALDQILHDLDRCDYVDIFGIVHNMRKERVWMVQNEQQYICIHQCLMAVLEGKENDHSAGSSFQDNDGFEDDEGISDSGM